MKSGRSPTGKLAIVACLVALICFVYVLHLCGDTNKRLKIAEQRSEHLQEDYDSVTAQLQALLEHKSKLERAVIEAKNENKVAIQERDSIDAQRIELSSQFQLEKTNWEQQETELRKQLVEMTRERDELQRRIIQLERERNATAILPSKLTRTEPRPEVASQSDLKANANRGSLLQNDKQKSALQKRRSQKINSLQSVQGFPASQNNAPTDNNNNNNNSVRAVDPGDTQVVGHDELSNAASERFRNEAAGKEHKSDQNAEAAVNAPDGDDLNAVAGANVSPLADSHVNEFQENENQSKKQDVVVEETEEKP